MSGMMSGGAGAGAGATSASTGPDFPTSQGATSASTGPDFPTSGATTGGASGGSSMGKASSIGTATGSIPIIGPIMSGIGSIFSGMQEGQADDNRSILYTQQAQLDRYNAGTQVTANSQRATQTLSAVSAQAGASGVTTEGSPTQAQRQTINRVNAADVTARWIGAIHASSDLYQSQLARWAGSQARMAGWISGGTDFAQAGIQAASIFAG